MKKNSLFLLISTILSVFNAFATDYYIDPQHGNDQNNGLSSNNAFKSLFKIDNINLQPGDTVFFMEGTYERPDEILLTINESGTEENYITFTNFENDTPVLQFNSWTGIDIIGGSSYIKIDGLHIKGNRSNVNLEDALNQGSGCQDESSRGSEGEFNGTGILAVGPNLRWSNPETTSVPHHIEVTNCEVFDCTSSGMAFQQADYITVTNNKVYNNCWYTIYGTSGINLYQFVNTDGTTGFHNNISNNLMYGNQLLVPQVPFCAFFDGNAFIIDDFDHTQTGNYLDINNGYDAYDAQSLIANNVSVENGGSGLHFFLSSNCHILNNTIVDNAFQNEGSNGNAELRIGSCNDFVVKNNIIKSENRIHANDRNTNIDYTHNYQFGLRIDADLIDCEGCLSEEEITFVNTDVDSDTPYITNFTDIYTDAGIILSDINDDFLGNPRPIGESFDLGAYELSNCEFETWYADTDNDTFGDTNDSIVACEQPEGYVATFGDECPNDTNKIIPGECGCGEIEGTCEEECELINWFADIDNDGIGYENDSIIACEQPEGYVANTGDQCPNDTNKITPGECGCGEVEGTCNVEENEENEEICDSQEYNSNTIYSETGTIVIFEGIAYRNQYYAQGILPTSGGPWEIVGFCDAKTTDCSSIPVWSASIAYAEPGTQVVLNQNIYENRYYIQGGIPGENNAWQLIGICESTISSKSISNNISSKNITQPNNTVQVYSLSGALLMEYNTTNETPELILQSGIYIIRTINTDTGSISVEKVSM